MHPDATFNGRYIFIWILIPFISGIILASFAEIPTLPLVVAQVILLVSIVILLRKSLKYAELTSLLFFILLFLAGISFFHLRQPKTPPLLSENTYLLEISDDLAQTKKSIRTFAKVVAAIDTNFVQPHHLLIYLPQNDNTKNLQPGDRIMAVCKPQKITNAGNPNEFDYAKYMATKGIIQTCFIQDNEYMPYQPNENFNIIYFAKRQRKKILSLYQNMNLTEKQFAVAAALTLGYKNALDREVKSAFSKSGAMHILAVSGLHVGIIYMFFLRLFSLIPTLTFRRYIQPILLLSALWSFAFISGLAPSVMRSSLMFSIFVIGNATLSKTNFFNKLAATAFILLLWKPYWLFDVGFQLSFSAVSSIVFFQQFVDKRMRKLPTIIKYFADSVSVSIIAQFGTLGFSLYYFHQFPTYFILTNLVAIPLAFILVLLSLFTLILAIFSTAAAISLSAILQPTLQLLIYTVETIENLPSSALEAISISQLQLLLFYLAVFSVGYYLKSKKRKHLYATLIIIVLFSLDTNRQDYRRAQMNEIVVFNVKKQSVIAWSKGGSTHFWTQDDDTSSNLKYATTPYLIQNYIPLRHTSHGTFNKQWYKGHMKIQNTRFYRWSNNSLLNKYSENPMHIDWLILSQNATLNIKAIKKLFTFKGIIIDSSNSIAHAKSARDSCTKYNIKVHHIAEQGALIIPLHHIENQEQKTNSKSITQNSN